MRKLKRLAAIATAVEFARQWARNNPDKAQQYIDKAAGLVNGRTQGKYENKVQGAQKAAKDAVAKEAGVPRSDASSATVPGTPTR